MKNIRCFCYNFPWPEQDYAINSYNYSVIDSENKFVQAIAKKENKDVATVTRNNRNSLHKVTHSTKLVYYDYHGDGKRKEVDLRGKSSLEIKQYLDYMEKHSKRKWSYVWDIIIFYTLFTLFGI